MNNLNGKKAMKEKIESDNENLADAFKRGVDYSKGLELLKKRCVRRKIGVYELE